jgi:hypothetical protein
LDLDNKKTETPVMAAPKPIKNTATIREVLKLADPEAGSVRSGEEKNFSGELSVVADKISCFPVAVFAEAAGGGGCS